MNRFVAGIAAGFVATLVLSVFMLIKSAMGMAPQVNAIQMLTKIGTLHLGLPLVPAVGWVLHFLIGSALWGVLYALLEPRLPGAAVVRGILFAVGAWVLMMIIPLPLAEAGLFGLRLGIAAPLLTLMLHIVYGAVLGWVFARLTHHSASGSTVSRTA